MCSSFVVVEPQEVHRGPILKLGQVPLDDILSFVYVNCTTNLHVVCKLVEVAFGSPVCITDDDIEQTQHIVVVEKDISIFYEPMYSVVTRKHIGLVIWVLSCICGLDIQSLASLKL